MSDSYDEVLGRLRKEIEIDGARPRVIDSLVTNLLEFKNENMSADLLLLISDQSECDEGMFSLIHAAESVQDNVYIDGVLSIFSKLKSSSPRWSSIVLMRILNGFETRKEIINQIKNSPESVKVSVHEMCDLINEVDPLFLSKTTPVSIATA